MVTSSRAGLAPIRSLPPGLSLSELQQRLALECELADRLRRATQEQRRLLYREVYDEYAQAFPPPPGGGDAAGISLQWELVRPFLGADVDYLEFGPGRGALGLRVASICRSVTLVEASPTLERRVPSGGCAADLHWVAPERAADELLAQHYGFAFSCHFLEHLHPDDLADHLQQVWDSLGDDGIYLAVTPNRLSGPHDVSGWFHREPRGFHLREYSHSEMAAAFRRAGFSDVRAWDGDAMGFRPVSWAGVRLKELALASLGPALRRHWFTRIQRRSPFRTLEQVVVSGRRR